MSTSCQELPRDCQDRTQCGLIMPSCHDVEGAARPRGVCAASGCAAVPSPRAPECVLEHVLPALAALYLLVLWQDGKTTKTLRGC